MVEYAKLIVVTVKAQGCVGVEHAGLLHFAQHSTQLIPNVHGESGGYVEDLF